MKGNPRLFSGKSRLVKYYNLARWVFPKIMVPPNHPCLIGFSIINHPFWGVYHPYFWFNIHITAIIWFLGHLEKRRGSGISSGNQFGDLFWFFRVHRVTSEEGKVSSIYPIGSMGLVYLPTFTYIYHKKQTKMYVYIYIYAPYMDPMGISFREGTRWAPTSSTWSFCPKAKGNPQNLIGAEDVRSHVSQISAT